MARLAALEREACIAELAPIHSQAVRVGGPSGLLAPA